MSKESEELQELKDITKTLLLLMADYNIIKVSDKRMKNLAKEYDLGPSSRVYGFALYDKKTIYYSDSKPIFDRVQTIIHELTHVYDENINIPCGDKDLSEERIDLLAAKWKRIIFGIKE